MRKHKATYSIPEDIYLELNSTVEQRKRSQFVAQAISRALEAEKQQLENAYKMAAQDRERLKEIEMWAETDREGWDD